MLKLKSKAETKYSHWSRTWSFYQTALTRILVIQGSHKVMNVIKNSLKKSSFSEDSWKMHEKFFNWKHHEFDSILLKYRKIFAWRLQCCFASPWLEFKFLIWDISTSIHLFIQYKGLWPTCKTGHEKILSKNCGYPVIVRLGLESFHKRMQYGAQGILSFNFRL